MSKGHAKTNTLNWQMIALLLLAAITFGLIIIYWSITRPFCANTKSCKDSLSLNVNNGEEAVFAGQKLTPPKIDLAMGNTTEVVLGRTDAQGEKHIYVNLTTQTLEAYEGDVLYLKAMVSTGKWGKTPTGEFKIWQKLRSTKMSGGSGNDYYYLPNVPYVMFFEGSGIPAGRGFGLHGAYWHNNFGHPMSHGCVNMKEIDAKKLYEWVGPQSDKNITSATADNPGTKITIHGQAPL